MARIPCPKCGASHTWVEQHDTDILLRCLCGLTKYLYREVGEISVMATAVPEGVIKLPKIRTKSYDCLLAVANYHPKAINTSDVAAQKSLESKETSALLMNLMYRGLVTRVKKRRGIIGGSFWGLTKKAQQLMKVV